MMNRSSMLRMMAAAIGLGGPLPLDNAHPAQREFLEEGTRKAKRRVNSGRPKIHADRPKPKERDAQYIKSRHKKLPTLLKKVWSVPKTKPTRIAQREQRIIDITARRFNIRSEQQFPLQAIILMADKGVRKAQEQYHKLASAAEYNNISVRQAYDHFVLGKELPG